MWKDLSMKERAAMMQVAIKNGIYDLGEIKRMYDEGGPLKENYSMPVESYSEYLSAPMEETVNQQITDNINFGEIKTTRERGYDPELIRYINDKLSDIPIKRRAVIIGDIIEESGGNPFSASDKGTYKGLLQWSDERQDYSLYDDKYKALDAQLDYIKKSMRNTKDNKSWTDGGTGSGYQHAIDAYNIFHDDNSSLEDMHHAFSFGYVRPKDKSESEENRMKVVDQVYNILNQAYNNTLK